MFQNHNFAKTFYRQSFVLYTVATYVRCYHILSNSYCNILWVESLHAYHSLNLVVYRDQHEKHGVQLCIICLTIKIHDSESRGQKETVVRDDY